MQAAIMMRFISMLGDVSLPRWQSEHVVWVMLEKHCRNGTRMRMQGRMKASRNGSDNLADNERVGARR